MSISAIEHAMIRIAFARVESPIAVFTCNVPGHVNAMFAATVKTQERIERGDPTLLGVFDASMNMRHIRAQLQQAARPMAVVG